MGEAGGHQPASTSLFQFRYRAREARESEPALTCERAKRRVGEAGGHQPASTSLFQFRYRAREARESEPALVVK